MDGWCTVISINSRHLCCQMATGGDLFWYPHMLSQVDVILDFIGRRWDGTIFGLPCHITGPPIHITISKLRNHRALLYFLWMNSYSCHPLMTPPSALTRSLYAMIQLAFQTTLCQKDGRHRQGGKARGEVKTENVECNTKNNGRHLHLRGRP